MNIKDLFRSIIYKVTPSWIYYRIAFLIKKKRLKKVNSILLNSNKSVSIFNILKKKKNNKKVFIFGGGSSINELTNKNYDEINKNCSIGINMWIFHRFITDYYMIELTNDDYLNEKYRLKILSLLKNKSKKPIFLVYRGSSNLLKISKWMYGMNTKRVFLYEYLRPDIFKKNLQNEFANTMQFLSKKIIRSNVLTLGIGASIERAISLSLLLGYIKIIILGIDIKNTKYFWSSKDKNFRGIKTGQKVNGPHLTSIKRFGGMKVQKSILILEQLARKKFNSRILISTNKSLLSKKLEKYVWKNK